MLKVVCEVICAALLRWGCRVTVCGGGLTLVFRETESNGVLDVKTTGLYDTDRVVEVAAVPPSHEGAIVDEWDTLVNPERDIGASAVHGVTASMTPWRTRFRIRMCHHHRALTDARLAVAP